MNFQSRCHDVSLVADQRKGCYFSKNAGETVTVMWAAAKSGALRFLETKDRPWSYL